MIFNDMVKSGYFMYMAEAEGCTGLVNTRTSKINAIIKDFKYLVKQGKNPNDYIPFVLAKYGLREEELTDRECEKIMGYVNGAY